MDNSDAPALNPNSTHKDASQMEWDYLPSQAQIPLPQGNSKTIEEVIPPKPKKNRLSGKEPTTIVAGKRLRKVSSKMKSTDSLALDKEMKKFYGIQVEVGSGSGTKGKANTGTSIKKRADHDSEKADLPPQKRQRKVSHSGTQIANTELDPDIVESEDGGTDDEYKDPEDDKDGAEGEDKPDEADEEGDSPNGELDDSNNEDVASRYASIQASRKKDGHCKPRQDYHNNCGHDPRTQDLHAMFTKGVRERKDKEDQHGRVCNVCHKELGKSAAASFFLGDNSTLHKHIERNFDTHGTTYLKKCKDLSIEPNHFAIPPEKKDKSKPEMVQASVDGFATSAPCWSKEGLVDHIIEFVVGDDQAFHVVEKGSFRAILNTSAPQLRIVISLDIKSFKKR